MDFQPDYMKVESIQYGVTETTNAEKIGTVYAVELLPMIMQRMEKSIVFLPCSDEDRLAYFQPLVDPAPGQKKC